MKEKFNIKPQFIMLKKAKKLFQIFNLNLNLLVVKEYKVNTQVHLCQVHTAFFKRRHIWLLLETLSQLRRKLDIRVPIHQKLYLLALLVQVKVQKTIPQKLNQQHNNFKIARLNSQVMILSKVRKNFLVNSKEVEVETVKIMEKVQIV